MNSSIITVTIGKYLYFWAIEFDFYQTNVRRQKEFDRHWGIKLRFPDLKKDVVTGQERWIREKRLWSPRLMT